MDRALEAVVWQISKLDCNHDIPYLAGYSIFISIVTCLIPGP